MDKALYVAMTGANQTMFAQAVHSNNLANASTVGFQADFAEQLIETIDGDGFQSRVYAITKEPGSSFEKGSFMTTERDLDIALQQQGMLAVQAKDTQEAYTREGNLQISSDGVLTTARGDLVLGQGGPISIPPASKLNIGSDGTISIVPLGSDSTELVNIDRLKTVRVEPSQMQKREDGLFVNKNLEPLEADASISVVSGVLESSNVNAVEEMISIMNLSRNFELQVKMMDTLDENEQMEQHLLEV